MTKLSQKGKSVATVKIIVNEPFLIPEYKTPGACAFDLHSDSDLLIRPGEEVKVNTGLKMEIPPGYMGEISLRSGGHPDIVMPNAPGKIDSDYRGPIKVRMRNIGLHPIKINKFERIAQMEIRETVRVALIPVEQLSETQRGEGGFGSTGKN